MQLAVEQSRWDLQEELIATHLDRAELYIHRALNDVGGALGALDPNGEAAILRSKAVRRDALRGRGRHDREWIAAVADAQFGMRRVESDPLVWREPQLPPAAPSTPT
jgi:hypothetical protein